MFDIVRRSGLKVPNLEVNEFGDHYEIVAEVPVENKEDIDIICDTGLLTISYTKEFERRTENVFSRKMASASTTLSLPEDVDEDKISAKLTNGVLDITVPRRA